jgi:hypothetical protein
VSRIGPVPSGVRGELSDALRPAVLKLKQWGDGSDMELGVRSVLERQTTWDVDAQLRRPRAQKARRGGIPARGERGTHPKERVRTALLPARNEKTASHQVVSPRWLVSEK